MPVGKKIILFISGVHIFYLKFQFINLVSSEIPWLQKILKFTRAILTEILLCITFIEMTNNIATPSGISSVLSNEKDFFSIYMYI